MVGGNPNTTELLVISPTAGSRKDWLKIKTHLGGGRTQKIYKVWDTQTERGSYKGGAHLKMADSLERGLPKDIGGAQKKSC